jgi:formate/nitrite transporter FocA (FNT family)
VTTSVRVVFVFHFSYASKARQGLSFVFAGRLAGWAVCLFVWLAMAGAAQARVVGV